MTLSFTAIMHQKHLSLCLSTIILMTYAFRGPGSSVGIATGYGDRIPVGGDFPHLSRLALGPTQPPVNGYRVFPGGKERPGRDADPSSTSSAVVKKEQIYTSTPSIGRTACTEPQCLYKGDLYLYLLRIPLSILLSNSVYLVFLTVCVLDLF